MTIFLNDFANYKLWTLKMLDASSTIPSGILQGNLKDIGMYDECISINVTKENMSIIGRHCMYTLSIIIPNSSIAITPTLSICSPDACNSNDVNNLLNSAINIIKEHINDTDLAVKSVTCSKINSEPWETGAIITIIALGSLICFLMICTICERVIKIKKFKTLNNSLLNAICKFSFYTNGKRILCTTVHNGDLPTIPGLRFFSMCWIILGHTYYNELSDLLINKTDPLQWVRSWSAIYILIGHFAVDTFLVISGVLVSYFFQKTVNKNHKFNLLNFYFHRWLRLTPALGVLLLFAVYIFPKFGSGPMWEAPMTSQSNYCSKNWWRILLYVQNYGSSENLMCLGYTWYLAVDMQLFLISPLILIPLIKKPKIGLSILGILIIVSMIIPAIVAVRNKFSWSLLFNLDETITANMMFYYYVPTYTRAGPYLLGILIGNLLASKKYQPTKVIGEFFK
ncbi:hypothetical protein PV325_009958 [Microctonus aethiopoides]|nr:hypothetical protein PV325_009958 [Microctonus aethiopoides]